MDHNSLFKRVLGRVNYFSLKNTWNLYMENNSPDPVPLNCNHFGINFAQRYATKLSKSLSDIIGEGNELLSNTNSISTIQN